LAQTVLLRMLGVGGIGAVLVLMMAGSGCASSKPPAEPSLTITYPDQGKPEMGGLSGAYQQEVLIEIERRRPAAERCYQDELNVRQDRGFRGDVTMLMTIGTSGRVKKARVIQSTINSTEVESCLVKKLEMFEFSPTENEGDIQYTYSFEPEY
jgi:hypothetical protein